jgi:P27 family predicted phage terminase small subunit
MGRRAEPAQSKVIKGNFRPDRHDHGPKVEMRAPVCPAWLPRHAKKYWREIAPQLEQAGLLAIVDSAVFAAHCDSVGRFEEVTRKLKRLDDLLDVTPQKYLVQSALFTIRNKLWDQVMRSSAEFGLTPAARSKVKDTGQQRLPFGGGDWDDV